MITSSVIQSLILDWQERMHNHAYPPEYREGILDCAFELSQLLLDSQESYAQAV